MRDARAGRAALCVLVAVVGSASCRAADGPAAPRATPSLQAKRVGPAPVASVTIGHLRFEAVPWGRKRGLPQNGGYVEAFDVASNASLWLLKVYDVHYDAAMESDVQDVFIERMTAEGDLLRVTDERGRSYLVDPQTRTVRAP